LPKLAYDTRLHWKIQYLGIGHLGDKTIAQRAPADR